MNPNLSRLTIVTVALAMAVALALPLVVQAGGGGGGGGFGGGGGGGGGFGGGGLNPAAARQSILGRVQQTVPFTDEEWSVIEPRLWKVVGLQTQLGQGNLGTINNLMRAIGGGGRGRGGGGAQPQVSTSSLYAQIFGQQDLVTTRAQELQVLLDDPNASSQVIGAKLTEYRQAVTRIKDLLEQARRDLISVLTVRQEACVLQMGYIE